MFRVYIQNAKIEIYQVKAERPLLVFLINYDIGYDPKDMNVISSIRYDST